MEALEQWWIALPFVYKCFWSVAVISSVVMLTMFIISLVIGDSDSDTDTDFDADSIGFIPIVLSFKAIMAFVVGSSWMGLSALYHNMSTIAVVLISIFSGILLMGLTAFLMGMFIKLQYNSTLDMNKVTGCNGVSYITIPPGRQKGGQVEILVNNSYKTFEAITDESTPIRPEEKIIVVEVLNDNILLIKRAEKTLPIN